MEVLDFDPKMTPKTPQNTVYARFAHIADVTLSHNQDTKQVSDRTPRQNGINPLGPELFFRATGPEFRDLGLPKTDQNWGF